PRPALEPCGADWSAVGLDDAKIIVRDVSEGGTGFDIADCINARHIRFKPVVNFHIALLVHLYARSAKIEMIHVGAPTRGNQQMRTIDRGFAAITVDSK